MQHSLVASNNERAHLVVAQLVAHDLGHVAPAVITQAVRSHPKIQKSSHNTAKAPMTTTSTTPKTDTQKKKNK